MGNNILVIGSGAREHAIVRALDRSPQEKAIFCLASNMNPGIAELCDRLTVGDINDPDFVIDYAKKLGATLAIIGPENPLAKGVADALWSGGVKTVGPKKNLAQLETSKAFARDLLKEYDIPGGPKYHTFGSMNGVSKFLNKLGENYYTYGRYAFKGESRGKRKNCKKTNIVVNYSYSVSNNNMSVTASAKGHTSLTRQRFRIWPADLVAHNSKFKTKEDVAEEENILADMVADARKICKVLGFEDGSEKFADCTLKLYTQKVDELVASRQAAYTTTQGQTTTQGSGSNVMTIYDPVRDSNALFKRGQGLINGTCTLGNLSTC